MSEKHTECKLKVTYGAGGFETCLSREGESQYPEEMKIAYVLMRHGMSMSEAEANTRRLCQGWNVLDDAKALVEMIDKAAQCSWGDGTIMLEPSSKKWKPIVEKARAVLAKVRAQ